MGRNDLANIGRESRGGMLRGTERTGIRTVTFFRRFSEIPIKAGNDDFDGVLSSHFNDIQLRIKIS